jgi:hypothetical protein
MLSSPAGLSERNTIAGKRICCENRLALLLVGLRALDRSEEAREQLAKEGLTITNKKTGVVHANPLLKIENENRRTFFKIWRDLGLRFDPSSTPDWKPRP